MAKDSRSKLLGRLAKLEAACSPASRRPTGVVRVRLSDGQMFAEELALNRGAPVMFAPEAASLEEWEAIAVASQRKLKDEVRK